MSYQKKNLSKDMRQTSKMYSNHPTNHPVLKTPRPAQIIEYVPYNVRNCIALFHICASSKFKLKQILAFSMRHGIPLTNLEMGRHLIYTAVSFQSLWPMHTIFVQIQSPDVSIWNTMIMLRVKIQNQPLNCTTTCNWNLTRMHKHILFFDCWICY